MADAFQNLTGRWLGRYDQNPPEPSVPFEADLVEEAYVLSGETTEPNTFRGDMGAVLSATLLGGRVGSSVTFSKHYLGFDQGDQPVYRGVADAALTRITGRWSFPGFPDLSGRFVMMRKPLAGARAVLRAEEELPVRVG